jgi:hypothetical protein
MEVTFLQPFKGLRAAKVRWGKCVFYAGKGDYCRGAGAWNVLPPE